MAADEHKRIIRETIQRAVTRWERSRTQVAGYLATDIITELENMELAGTPVRIIEGEVFRCGDPREEHRRAHNIIKVFVDEVRTNTLVNPDRAADTLIASLTQADPPLFITEMRDP